MTNKKSVFSVFSGGMGLSGLFLMGLLSTSMAQAGVYVNANGGLSSMAYEDVDTASGSRLSLGYQFTPLFGLEASKISTSGLDVDGMDWDISHSGTTFSGVFTGREEGVDNVFYKLKVIYYKIETDYTGTEVPGGPASFSSSGLGLGAGIGLGAEKGFRLLMDFDLYFDVEDGAEDKGLDLITLGVGYQF